MTLQILGTWDFDGCVSTHYLAEEIGDGLPMHEHPINHTCKVEAGEVKITVAARTKIMGPLENPVDLPGNTPHSIIATQPMTRFTNTLPRNAAQGTTA